MNLIVIYVKDYGILSFAESISKNLNNKYSPKRLDSAKKYYTDAIKIASNIAIQITAGTTTDWIGNNIVDKIAKVSQTTQNNLEAIKSGKNIPKQRYVSPEKRRQIIDKLKTSIII